MITQPDIETVEVRGMQAGRVPAISMLRNRFNAFIRVLARGEPIPPADRSKGCDTSYWEGLIDFHKMSGAGGEFCIFKASQGTTIKDGQFDNSRVNVGNLMPWAGYHFLSTADGILQANKYYSVVGTNRGKLIPALDVELASVNSSVIKAYCVRHYTLFGMYPIIYTSAYFWENVFGSDKAWVSANCPLWVAHWDTLSPILPAGWTSYLIHQYTYGPGLGPTYGSQDSDMDLNYCRKSWLQQYVSTWAKDITAWARTQPNPYTGPDPA